MNINQFMNKHLYKEEVQDLAERLELDTSGKKNDIINRIIACKDFDIEEVTRYFFKEQLYSLCWEYDLPVSGSKGDLWQRLVAKLGLDKEVLTIEELEQEKEKAAPITSIEHIIEDEIAKEEVIDEELSKLVNIIEQWIPDRRYKGEEGYQAELSSLLKHKHGFKVQNEVGSTQIDILVNDTIPIELKKNPKRGDFDRLSGQIIRNIDAYGKLIVVVCQLETKELFLEYKNSLNNRYSSDELIFILKS